MQSTPVLSRTVFHIPVRSWLVALCFWIAMICIVFLSGCSFLQTNVGPTAKKVTDYYCAQPLEQRLIVRAEIAKAIAPATLTLVCPGDKTAANENHDSQHVTPAARTVSQAGLRVGVGRVYYARSATGPTAHDRSRIVRQFDNRHTA